MSPSDLEPPVRRGPRHAAPRRRRRFWPRKRWVQVTLTIGLVMVVAVASYSGYVWYEANRVNHVAVNGLTDGPSNGTSQGTENILMVGSTDRCSLKVQNPIYGICSQGVTGVNSDVVMILHLNPAKSKISILSIPRDTFIPNARKDGANKIDAALAEGPAQLVNAIQQDFGIPIQHFVELNFDTFAGVVDALRGLDMYFPRPVYDSFSQLKQLTSGCVHLDGFHALTLVRARHLQYQPNASYGSNPANWPQEPQSDLARIRRNHEFLRVLAAAVSKQGLGNPITDAKLIAAVAPQLTVDSGFSTSHMADLILAFHTVDAQKAPQLTLPVMPSNSYSYVYKGYDYGNVEFPDNVPDLLAIQEFLGVSALTNTMTGRALPKPSTITVSVLNGSGTYNQGASTAAELGQLGYKIGTIGDRTPVGNPAQTFVAYNSTKPEVIAQAQRVLRSLSGQVVLAYEPNETAPITVITGTHFAVIAPVAPPVTTTTTKASGGPSTTASVPSTTTTTPVSGFSPTTPATSDLAEWDPRSCTANRTAGP